jgi:hypothetical protein
MTTREEILGRYRDDREAKKYGYYDYELWLEERLIEAHIELSKLHQPTVISSSDNTKDDKKDGEGGISKSIFDFVTDL